MSITKQHRRLNKLLNKHGMYLKPMPSGHVGIFRIADGQRRYTMAASPSRPYYVDNTIHDLVKAGDLPVSLKGTKIH